MGNTTKAIKTPLRLYVSRSGDVAIEGGHMVVARIPKSNIDLDIASQFVEARQSTRVDGRDADVIEGMSRPPVPYSKDGAVSEAG